MSRGGNRATTGAWRWPVVRAITLPEHAVAALQRAMGARFGLAVPVPLGARPACASARQQARAAAICVDGAVLDT
jgi:hypothetical protein